MRLIKVIHRTLAFALGRTVFASLLAMIALLVSGAALAKFDIEQPRLQLGYKDLHRAEILRLSKQASSSKNGMTLGEAIAIARQRNPGEVLSARRAVDGRGQSVYIIKILSNKGVVKKVRISAQ